MASTSKVERLSWVTLVAMGLALPSQPAAVEPSSPAPAVGNPAPTTPATTRKKVATWQIGPLAVLSPGAVKRLPEGKFTEGYTVTAFARASAAAPFPEGTFTMTLASFTPDKDMPKQPKGFFYVKGAWRLVRTGSKVPAGARHSPEALQGQVVAKLPVDPTAGKGGWSATLRTPKGATFGTLSDLAGTLTVNEVQEGTLFLQMQEAVSGDSR